jgi:hypothetical protein
VCTRKLQVNKVLQQQTENEQIVPQSGHRHLSNLDWCSHRHLSYIDCLMAHTACLVCFIESLVLLMAAAKKWKMSWKMWR